MTEPHPRHTVTDWLRLPAMGALAGMVAGAVAGLAAFGIENLIVQLAVAKYGNAAVDSGYNPLRAPGAIVTMALLGGFFGLAYAVATTQNRGLSRWGGAVFAVLLAVGMQPLLLGRMSLSAVVTVHEVYNMPDGFVKAGDFGQELLPLPLAVAAMAVLVFLMGMLIHHLLGLATQRVPRLPASIYAFIAGIIGIPGLYLFGLFFLFAIGAIGEE